MSVQVMTRARLAAAVVAVAIVAGGCGGEPPDVGDGGAVGPDEATSPEVELFEVRLEHPLDGVHDEGEDVRLFLGIANTGTVEDDLVDVRGPDFTDAVLTVDGRAAVVPVPAGDTVHVDAAGSPSIVLQDLQTPLRSSESIPVTFVFEEAGEVTVDAVVSAAEQPQAPPLDLPDSLDDPRIDRP